MPDKTITKMPSPEGAVRLLSAKRIAIEGDRLVGRADDVSRILAVLLLDLSVETALKTVLNEKSIQIPWDFPKMLKEATQLLGSVPDVMALHNARNSAQHHGRAPAPEHTRDFRDASIACLRAVFGALGADYDRFTLVDLVLNPVVRDPLDLALTKTESNPDEAIALAARALGRLRGMVKELVGGAWGIEMWTFRSRMYEDKQWIANCADNRQDFAIMLMKALSGVAMGFDMAEHVRFRRLVFGRRVEFAEEGEPSFAFDPNRAETGSAEALWVIDYVARHAYRMERGFPEIIEPGFEAKIPPTTDPEREERLRIIPSYLAEIDDE